MNSQDLPPKSEHSQNDKTSVSGTITRRGFLRNAALATVAASLSKGTRLLAANRKRPNLVFFFTDQQSWDMVGCNGNSQILTPSLDRFSRTALNFDHCVSNCPVCTPARGMILSGQHPLFNGAFNNDTRMLAGNDAGIGEILQQEGYRTGYIGKWHLYGGDRNRPIPPGPDRHGFETFLSNNCTLDFSAKASFYFNDAGERVHFNEWEPYGQTRQAVNYLKTQSAEKPFALFLSLHPPHDQGVDSPGARRYETIPELTGRYDRNAIRMRPNAKIPEEFLARLSGSERDKEEQRLMEQLRNDYHGYYSMISGCDDCFGQVLDALKANGLEDNTIVVFTSDHGDLLYSHGRPWAKSFPEDESVRVPLLIRYPGFTAENQRTRLLFGTLDFMPTLLAMMGIEPPKHCHGKNLAQPIRTRNEDAVASQPLFYFLPSWRGVYTRRYTYATDEFNGRDIRDWRVLYDRENDPHQQVNLFGSAEHESIRQHLQALSEGWLAKFGDPNLNAKELLARLGQKSAKFLNTNGTFGGRPIDLITRQK